MAGEIGAFHRLTGGGAGHRVESNTAAFGPCSFSGASRETRGVRPRKGVDRRRQSQPDAHEGAGPLFRNCWASHCLLVMSREGAELAERTVAVADEIDTVFPARFRGFTPTRYARRVTSRLQETRVMREPALTAAPPCEYRRNWTLRAAERAMCDVACRR